MSEESTDSTLIKKPKLKRTALGVKHYKQLRAVLKSLCNGASINGACKAASLDRTTFFLWRQKKPRLDFLVNAITDARIQDMEDAHYKKGIEGSVAAQIFFLCNRAPQRWHNVADIKNIIYNMPGAGKDGKEEPVDRFKNAPRVVFTD